MQNIQEQIERYYKSLRATVTFPISIKVVDEIPKLDTQSLIDDYKVEMTKNFDSWYHKHKEKFQTGDKKLGYIFFEHSYPHSENMTAEAYGIPSDSPRDEDGRFSLYSIMRDFTASGRITLKALNPLVIFYEETIEDDYKLSSEIEEIRQIYYQINALLLGRAIDEVIYTSPFATICSRPFGVDIQEHDSPYSLNGVAYTFWEDSGREEIIDFNPSLLQYEIENLFKNSFSAMPATNNLPAIYNIKFSLDIRNCSISFENKESSDEEVKRLNDMTNKSIEYYTSIDDIKSVNEKKAYLIDRNYHNHISPKYLPTQSFSVFSIPCNMENWMSSSYFLNNIEIKENIYHLISSLIDSYRPKIKELNLHPDCMFIAFGGYNEYRKTWVI